MLFWYPGQSTNSLDVNVNKQKKIQQIFKLNILDAKIPSDIQEDKYIFFKETYVFYPYEDDYSSISNNIQYCTLNQFNDFIIFPVIYLNLNRINQIIDLIECLKYISFYTFFTWISFLCQCLIEQIKNDFLKL